MTFLRKESSGKERVENSMSWFSDMMGLRYLWAIKVDSYIQMSGVEYFFSMHLEIQNYNPECKYS